MSMTPEQKKKRVNELLEELDSAVTTAIGGGRPTAAHLSSVDRAKAELEKLDPDALDKWYEKQNTGLSKHMDKAILISALGAFGSALFGLVKLLKDSKKA